MQCLDIVYFDDNVFLHLVLFFHLVLEAIQKTLHSLSVFVLFLDRDFELSHDMVASSQQTEDAGVTLLLLLICKF